MNKQFLPFEEARKFSHSLKLKTAEQWAKYSKSGKKPDDIPANPSRVYKNKGWISWGDWMGTGFVASKKRKYRIFQEARRFVRSLKIKNESEWRTYTKSGRKPTDIPADPKQVYKNKGWKGFGDWLGTGRIATFERKYRSFEDARKFVRSLKLKDGSDWIKFTQSKKMPKDIPTHPDRTYKKEWKRMGDWLGTGAVATYNRVYLPFSEARKFVRTLGLKNQKEWYRHSESNNFRKDIPNAPWSAYKDKGWTSFGDWLGTGTVASTIIAKNWLPYKEAKIEYQKIAKKYELKRLKDWRNFINSHELPKGLPKYPWEIYTEERVLRKLKR